MLVVVERTKVLRALEHTRYSIPRKTSLPVLRNVLIDVQGTELRLTTTDLTTFVTSKVKLGTRQTDGRVTVRHDRLLKVLQSMPQDIVVLTADESSLRISAGSSTFDLKGISAEDFALAPRPEGPHLFTMPIPEFLNKLGKVLPFAATDDTRPILQAVQMGANLVAADGFRMAIAPLYETVGTRDVSGVIHKDTMTVVSKVLKKLEGTVSVVVNVHEESFSGAAFFATPDVLIGGTLVEGEFPDYVQVIPKVLDLPVHVDVEELVTVLKQANVFATIRKGSSRGVVFEAGERLMVQAKASDMGQFEGSVERLDEEPVISDQWKAINGDYLVSMLRVPAFRKGDVVRLEWEKDKRGPFVLSNETADDGALYLIMPMHADAVNARDKARAEEEREQDVDTETDGS